MPSFCIGQLQLQLQEITAHTIPTPEGLKTPFLHKSLSVLLYQEAQFVNFKSC